MNKQYWKGKAFSIGYKHSKKNQELYYKNDGKLLYFLNFELKFKKFNMNNFAFPLTFKNINNLEEWEKNRLLNLEKKKFKKIGFNIYIADIIPHGFASTSHGNYCYDFYIDMLFDTSLDGYCKLCGKDIQKNSLSCKDCRKKEKSIFVSNAKRYIAKEVNSLKSCMVCGKKLSYSVDNLLYRYSMHNYRKHYFNSVSEGYDILKKLNGSFKLYEPQKFLINHHLCYFDEFTIDVCPTCHARIHHSNMEEYKQYIPIDKRPTPIPPNVKTLGILGGIL